MRGERYSVEEMFEQQDWYITGHHEVVSIAEMTDQEKRIAIRRLEAFALGFARTVFRNLYAYGTTGISEQADIDLERGEAEAEAVMSSDESARSWIRRTALYGALKGEPFYEAPEDEDEPFEPPVASELVYVGISNTDGRLSIDRWQRFHIEVNSCLSRTAEGAGTLRWFSPPTEGRLGAMFAAKVPREAMESLRKDLDRIRQEYQQDEIAFATGVEDFIR